VAKAFSRLLVGGMLCAATLVAEDMEQLGYNRVYVGPQAYAYRLQIESDDIPEPFTGCLGGVVGGYEYKKPDSLYTLVEGSYASGTITTSDTGNNKRNVDDGLLDLRVGYNGTLASCFNWTLYTGGGFRWNRQQREEGALSALTFNYYKIYIPLGILLDYTFNETVNVGLDFTWMPDVLSMVSLSSMQGSYWELERMNNYQVEIPCLFTVACRYQVIFAPFWRHFWDGASTAVTNGGMPLDLDKQMTNNWGASLSLGVLF
jgi:hypothetical protein